MSLARLGGACLNSPELFFSACTEITRPSSFHPLQCEITMIFIQSECLATSASLVSASGSNHAAGARAIGSLCRKDGTSAYHVSIPLPPTNLSKSLSALMKEDLSPYKTWRRCAKSISLRAGRTRTPPAKQNTHDEGIPMPNGQNR
jgi:hypothetical protein